MAASVCKKTGVEVSTETFKPNQSAQHIIEAVRANGEISRRLIAKETGLSTPSVTRLINGLVSADFLQVDDSSSMEGAGPGRPASIIKLNPDCGCIIGVDVGEHLIQVALGDMNGNILAKSEKPTDAEQGGDVTCKNIAAGVDEVLAEHGAQGKPDQPLRAITIGAPGTIDPVSSRVVKAPMINGWSNFDLKGKLRERLPMVPLRIENDNNSAVIGEYAVGVAKGVDNFVYASIRRGIGAGIFINGKLYRGSAGFAGEMGKMVWDSNFAFSPNSGLGYLESICAEDAIVEREKQALAGLEAANSQRPTMRSISKAAAAGNPKAIEILTSILDPLGLAVANIASLLNPQVIVLGGDIHFAMDIAVNGLNETIGKLIPTPPQVLASSLGDQAIIQGTLYQAHQDACDRLLASTS